MNILVTGVAGFIGFHLAKQLVNNKKIKYKKIIGIDNLNNYYDISLKKKRCNILKKNKNFVFIKSDLKNYNSLSKIFSKYKINIVINLAAQAGVRYSIKNPAVYFETNIQGFFNILDLSRQYKVKHLISASTSSVYGDNNKFPITEKFNTDKPLSFYAATKKSNEVMAYSYSQIFNLPITMLRFFTVYGPWGRPDMFLFKYVEASLNNKQITLFNSGNHIRDFTYVEDVAKCISKIISLKPKSKVPYEVYNIGSNKPIYLKDFIKEIDKLINKKPKIKNVKLQLGDIYKTHSNSNKIYKKINYKPSTGYKLGIKNFIDWYLKFKNK